MLQKASTSSFYTVYFGSCKYYDGGVYHGLINFSLEVFFLNSLQMYDSFYPLISAEHRNLWSSLQCDASLFEILTFQGSLRREFSVSQHKGKFSYVTAKLPSQPYYFHMFRILM